MVAESAGAPGTTGLTLTGAVAPFRSFGAGYNNANATVDVRIQDAADETIWEVARNCAYTHSGTTLSRGTFENSSTGSLVNFTGAVVVSVVATAHTGNLADLSNRGVIQGLEISYSSTTAIAVAAGTCAINGKLLTYAGGTLTSGSTWKNNNNDTVTIGASKAYYVYAFDNAGTLEIRVQDYAAATYGGAPTWDSAYDYWIAPSVGAQARRIGAFWTDGSSNILVFWWNAFGRRRDMFIGRDKLLLVNAGTSTSFASVTITPYIGADSEAYKLCIGSYSNSGTAVTGTHVSTNSGTTEHFQARVYAVYGTGIYHIVQGIPNTGTLHYKAEDANTRAMVLLVGLEMLV